MSDAPKPVWRYRSTVGAEQASSTKRRVIDAAKRFFLERGIPGTTLSSVAETAGVSAATIYATFGSKRTLLEGVIDATIMGPEWRAAQIGRSIAFTPGYYAPYGSYSCSTREQPHGT